VADQLQRHGPRAVDWLIERAELAYVHGHADPAGTWREIALAAIEMLDSYQAQGRSHGRDSIAFQTIRFR